MYSIENNVGRLIEIRLASPVSLQEVQNLLRIHSRIVLGVQGKYVSVIDLRKAHVFPQEVTEILTRIMTHANPKLERSGLLIGESAIFGLQVERVIHEGGTDHRRPFREPVLLVAWLGEVLSEPERERARLFLQGDSK